MDSKAIYHEIEIPSVWRRGDDDSSAPKVTAGTAEPLAAAVTTVQIAGWRCISAAVHGLIGLRELGLRFAGF